MSVLYNALLIIFPSQSLSCKTSIINLPVALISLHSRETGLKRIEVHASACADNQVTIIDGGVSRSQSSDDGATNDTDPDISVISTGTI